MFETTTASPTDLETNDRLLRAAGEVFAEHGFRRATVREICSRAGANIAAVNYYFGDKARLYSQVLRYGVGLALQKYPPDMGLPTDRPATAEERLHAFVRALLYRLLDDGPYAWHGKLMLWEMIEPTQTGALEELVQEAIRPLYQRIDGIVTELLGKAATPERVRLGIASTLGQCIFYRSCRPMLSRVQPGATEFSAERVEGLADHVTRFTVAGLRAYHSTTDQNVSANA